MPWNNQSGGGPWGSGSKGPWGSGPQSQGPRPPDLEDFLRRPHQELSQIGAQVDDFVVTVGDFSHLPTHCKFVGLMPQWEFLNFIAEKAKAYPGFHLRLETETTDLLIEDGKVAGVRAKSPNGAVEVRADLTIGADGRRSIVREKAGFEVLDLGAPGLDIAPYLYDRDLVILIDEIDHDGNMIEDSL